MQDVLLPQSMMARGGKSSSRSFMSYEKEERAAYTLYARRAVARK